MAVTLNLYDLSMGMASSMSQSLLGKQIDYVPHTGIVFGGYEYFFGGGIQMLPPSQVVQAFGISPIRTISLGTTTKSKAEFHRWIDSVRPQFTQQTYDLFRHNCNNFSDAAAKFLLNGTGIPKEIIDLPKVFLETPLGQMLAPMLSQQMDTMNASVAAAGGQFQSTSSGTPTTTATSSSSSSSSSSSDYVAPTTTVPGPAVTIKVMEVKGETLDIHLPGITATLGDFRQRVADAMQVSSTPGDIRLIFNGKVLTDMQATVASCGIENGYKVLIAKKARGSGSSGSSGAQKTTTRTSATTPSTTSFVSPTSGGSASPAAAFAAPPVPVSNDPIDRAIARICTSPREQALTCLQTIEKICKNIKENPMDAKYRKLKVANAAFQRRVSGVPGGTNVLAAIGFKEVTDGGENHGSHVLTPSADLWNILVAAQTKLEAAVQRLQSGGRGGGGSGGGMDMQGLASMAQAAGLDMNAMSGLAQQAGSMDPQAMQSMVAAAMSNPQIMQQAMSMMNNPQMNNEQMMQNMQQMMSDPQAMQQAMSMVQQNPQMLQQMMSGRGMSGLGGGIGGGGIGGGGPQNTFAPQVPSSAAAPASSGVQVDEEKVQQMVAMGISADRAREALRITQNNVDYAVARLFG